MSDQLQRIFSDEFSGWDKGLDYTVEAPKLERLVRETEDLTEKAFYALFLIDVVNGARISESIDAALKWAENGKHKQRVRVRKHKKRAKLRQLDIRSMWMPAAVYEAPELKKRLREMAKEYKDFENVASKRCERMLGYNTHALRWCRISYWSNVKKDSVQIIAARTGQLDTKTIVGYIQQQEAEKGLAEEMQNSGWMQDEAGD